MTIRLPVPNKAVTAGVLLLALAGCANKGDFDETGGIFAVRSACPSVGVPAGTGDITLFNPPQSRDARAIDVVANITNLRATCTDGPQIYSEANFTVQARRNEASGARQVVLPYFVTVVQGGGSVVSKRVGQVALNFAPGEYRTVTSARGGSYVDRAVATLPEDIQKRINRRRKPGDLDAATDPLSEPEVRAALQRASFEMLIGFNLTQDQLRYNVTR